MVDGEARKTHDMNNRRAVAAKGIQQLARYSTLMRAGEREDHAPMAFLEIAPPCATALGLEHILPSAAEIKQVGVARNDNSACFGQNFARTHTDYLAYQLAIRLRIDARQ